MTNLSQTQCLSSHLTTFAAGFLVLPSPISWNYAFSDVDFSKDRITYLAAICAGMLYLVMMMITRLKSSMNTEKVDLPKEAEQGVSEDGVWFDVVTSLFSSTRKLVTNMRRK